MTLEEYKAAKSAMFQKYKAGEITNYAYIQWKKKNDPSLQGNAAASSPQTAPQPMTHAEYIGLWEELKKQKKAGKISNTDYGVLGAKLDKLYNQKESLPNAKTALGLDPGSKATNAAEEQLEKELKRVYKVASIDLKSKLKEFTDEFGKDLAEKQKLVAEGKMTQADLQSWINGQHRMMDILYQKIDQCTGVMLNTNKVALGMVNGNQVNVFAQNANWQSYQLTQDTKLDLMFSVYDENTVKKLIRDKPELLPRKVVNGKKDKAWNQKKMANAVVQAVIQGESIPGLAARIAAQTGETNLSAMIRYARTAMTAAQNSGRMEMLHRAQGMGINVKKVWMATLDGRTRDSHAAMDGKRVDVDDKFPNGLEYPGDPNGPPSEVYNCRCTLVYDYEGFPNDPTEDMRYDNESGQLIANMDYTEWKAAKEGGQLNDLNAAKLELAELQKKVVQQKIKEDKIYEGLWKDPVTLADYPDKAAGIAAKRDYYTTEIAKYQQAQAEGKSWATDEKIKELEKKRKLLNEFELRGQLIQKRNEALKAIQDLYAKVGLTKSAAAPAVAKTKAKKAAKTAGNTAAAAGGKSTGTAGQTGAKQSLAAAGGMKTPFGPDAYTKERKDKALWSSDRKKVDSMMRDRTGEVWSKASREEKEAIYEYTRSFSKFNEPLRGIQYGTSVYKGVGNTDLNAGARNNGRYLNAMTDIIDKCSYDHDQWFQRGCGWGGMDKFLQCSESLLRGGTQKQLENELLGKTITEYGFMSMGSAKGKGFSGNILFNIYAPAGTKMMYVEPISAFGNGSGLSWDGKTKQSGYGSEFETIMQQGTQFRITKVERSGGQIFIDIEVINQDKQQRWKK